MTAARARPGRWARAAGLVGALCLLVAVDCGARALTILRLDPHDGDEPLVASSYAELPSVEPGEELAVDFRFAPRARAEVLTVLFGLDRDLARERYHVLRLSGNPSVPSVLQRFEDGEERASHALAVGPIDGAVDVGVDVRPGVLEVRADGREIFSGPLDVDASRLAIALQPSSPLGRFHVPYVALPRIEVRAPGRAGAEGLLLGWRPWERRPVRFALLIGIGLGCAYTLRRSRRATRGLVAFAALALLGPPAILATILATSPLTERDREDLRAGTRLFEDGPGAAGGAPSLRIATLGGSVTHGYPEADRIDPYPTQLARRLSASPALEGTAIEVVNLGRPTLRLWQIIEAWGPVLARDRPDVAVLSSVFNNLEEGGNPRIILAQAFGLADGVELAPDAPQPQAYERGLRCFAELARLNGIETVWLEEFVDPEYFQGRRVLEPLHAVLERVARDEGVDLLRYQDAVASRAEPLLFYEFIHPTSLGHRAIVEPLVGWFEERALRAPAPRHDGPVRGPDTIEACREGARGIRRGRRRERRRARTGSCYPGLPLAAPRSRSTGACSS